MKIDMPDDDLDRFLDLLFLAGKALTAHKEEDDRTAPYLAVIQRAYAQVREGGREDLVVFDGDLERYKPARSQDPSSEIRRLLDEFFDETFWHELVFRLTDRDLERQTGGEKAMLLTDAERTQMEAALEERYMQEFGEHGIDRLEVVERIALRGTQQPTSD